MEKRLLSNLYFENKLSMAEIANKLDVSLHKVAYWMEKHSLKRRSRSEATYVKHNPNGNPFKVKKKLTPKEERLLGLGLGIYWGEGNKTGYRVRVSNSDPRLIRKFIEFLVKICQIKKSKLRFWLQIFEDTNKDLAKKFWTKRVGIKPKQFYKVTVTASRGKGSYKKKAKYGVLSVIFGNVKLKRKILSMINAGIA